MWLSAIASVPHLFSDCDDALRFLASLVFGQTRKLEGHSFSVTATMLPFKHTACRELSTELLDQHEWHPSLLRSISFLLDISALAVDPVARLLAVGMARSIDNDHATQEKIPIH